MLVLIVEAIAELPKKMKSAPLPIRGPATVQATTVTMRRFWVALALLLR